METQPHDFSDMWMNSPETPPMFAHRSLCSGGTVKRFQKHTIVQLFSVVVQSINSSVVILSQNKTQDMSVTLPEDITHVKLYRRGLRVHPRNEKPLHPVVVVWFVEWVAGVRSWAFAFGLHWCQAYDAKEKEARAEEGCGNSRVSTRVSNLCNLSSLNVRRWWWWSRRGETGEDVSGSVFYHCTVAASREGSSCSLKANSSDKVWIVTFRNLTQSREWFHWG